MSTNKHGLSRYIPSEVSREVRQRCGFGCVICGNAVYTYEHIDPPFADAHSHDPDKIALLCGGCHGKVTRGILSKATLLSHLRSPKAFEYGFSRDAFDITASNPTIEFCGTTYTGIRTIVAMMGMEILTVAPPECEGAPMRISAMFCDSHGSEIFRVVKNEWFSNAANWDVEICGPTISFRRAPGDIALVLRAEPPRTIVIERISMYYKGARIVGEEGGVVDARGPNGGRITMSVKRVTGSGKGVAFFISDKRVIFAYSGDFEDLAAKDFVTSDK